MKEVISLEDLKINEDGSFSMPTSSRLEKSLEKFDTKSLNNRCVNGSCNGSENVRCNNQDSCNDSTNQTNCKNGDFHAL